MIAHFCFSTSRARQRGFYLKQTVILVLLTCFLFVGGCTSVGRGMGKITGSKYAEQEAGFTWNVPAPELEPPSQENNTVWVRCRNISDASEINLTQAIQRGVEQLGYRVVQDPKQAAFRLRATIRYFGENEAIDGGRSQANMLGVITGAGVGLGTGAVVHSVTGSGMGAMAAGVGAGGISGIGMKNAMSVREWNLIVDILLEERMNEEIEFEVASDRSTNSTTSSRTISDHDRTSRNTVGGGASDRTSRNASVKMRSNYFPHGIRLTGWARQIRMTRQEAIPLVVAKIRAAIPQLLP